MRIDKTTEGAEKQQPFPQISSFSVTEIDRHETHKNAITLNTTATVECENSNSKWQSAPVFMFWRVFFVKLPASDCCLQAVGGVGIAAYSPVWTGAARSGMRLLERLPVWCWL